MADNRRPCMINGQSLLTGQLTCRFRPTMVTVSRCSSTVDLAGVSLALSTQRVSVLNDESHMHNCVL